MLLFRLTFRGRLFHFFAMNLKPPIMPAPSKAAVYFCFAILLLRATATSTGPGRGARGLRCRFLGPTWLYWDRCLCTSPRRPRPQIHWPR
jgi:hypothetical protein